MHQARTLPLLLVFSLGLPGCFWVTTKHEGQTLRRDVNQLEERVETQEEALGGSVQKLESTLEEASKLLARNSADLGAEVDGLVQDNARLTGLVMEAKRYADEVRSEMQRTEQRLAEVEARLVALETKTPAPATKSAEELYDEGMSAFRAGKYGDSRAAFRTLVVRYPGHERAPEAQFHRGESYSKEGNHEAALKEFQVVFEKFAASPLADDALYRAGQAAEALKWCTDARAYYGLLRQKFPRSDLAKKSKARDAQLKKLARNKKKCQS